MWYVLSLVLGVVLGIMAAVPGMIFFLRSDAGLTVLRNYVAPQPEWPEVNVPASTDATAQVAKFAEGAVTIGVPRVYAGAEYSVALNGAVKEVALIATTSQRLVTLLTQINAKSLSRDYNGLFDLVADAKGLISQQEGSIVRFHQSLTALSAANQTTPDTQTKSLTQELYTKGLDFHASLQVYVAALDTILSGSVPTAQQIKDMDTAVANATQKGAAFSDTMKLLLQRFTGAVQGSTVPQR